MKKSISKIVTLWLALVLCFPVPFYAAFAEGEEKETVVQEPIEQSDAEEQVIGEDKKQQHFLVVMLLLFPQKIVYQYL